VAQACGTEFKAKFKHTAGAGLNLRSVGVKFKISYLLRGGSGVNFKSASLNLHGDKEMKFKSALVRLNLLKFSARAAL